MKHTIVALVLDKPGVLNRITSMIRRRGFNISSLAVGASEAPSLSRMSFVVEGGEETVKQVTKQLQKIIDVVKVADISKENVVARELALIKVTTTPATRSEIVQLVDIFRAGIIDVGSESLIIEVTGDEEKINSLARLLEPFGVKELMRTGRLAMVRGSSTVKIDDDQLGAPAPRTASNGAPSSDSPPPGW